MKASVAAAVATFGENVKGKLTNPAAKGDPEDQLRGPFEILLAELAALLGFPPSAVVAVGETAVRELKTRPDYSVTVQQQLVGFIELKAPNKGANPRKFKEKHDKEQWEKLQSLPNLIFTDGNEFSLWQNGEPVQDVVRLEGHIETAGKNLRAPAGLLGLFERFLRWHPIPPTSAKELARTTALLCRLLREEVTEQLEAGSSALTELAEDWRHLLFPDADNEKFADGYAQAVTFGLLMARAKDIKLASGLERVAKELRPTSSLIGAALQLLTEDAENQMTLKTSLGTLVRVLDEVHWPTISKGNSETWLYFYEDFLEIYDNKLRKQTGSYYTPPEVVEAMVRLVDDVLRSGRFGLHSGLASSEVTLVDPATGTGTFMLGVLRKIAESITLDEGAGAVGPALAEVVQRLIAFEMQLGPFAVAQLRILAEIVELTGALPPTAPRMFVTNTLGNPYDEEGWIPGYLAPIGKSRKDANRIKREEAITVVIGNPPYKEKAKGLGGWIEGEGKSGAEPPLAAWMPPGEWGLGAHSKHLRNLYVYFWRWATWKVFDCHQEKRSGIVCFITVAGFLNGPGFEKMRDYLRRTCDDIWVIDCSPEGHQPDVSDRIFQGVQQPICIVLASRSGSKTENVPARVRFTALPAGGRQLKFEALTSIDLNSQWLDCPAAWRAPFLPESAGAWLTYPSLDSLFLYSGSGVMPGRTWVIAPDKETLKRRWGKLIAAPPELKEIYFLPHLLDGQPGDKHSRKPLRKGLPGVEFRPTPVASDSGPCLEPVAYGFRTLDRQWLIPDGRLINRPNPSLWEHHSDHQIYLTAFARVSPRNGPALTVTGLIPDLDHYKGSFGGRVYPLWRSRDGQTSNLHPRLLETLQMCYAFEVSPADFFAYVVAVAAHPAFTERFQEALATPGIRVPITASGELFARASRLGRVVVWLFTFGERMADEDGQQPRLPRLPEERRPRIPAAGQIPQDAAGFPDSISFEEAAGRLWVGAGYVENVTSAMWRYEVSGKQVLLHWFSYRKATRDRPVMGDRRKPSPLSDVQPDHWLPEYSSELLNLLNVLGLLIEQEPEQAALLEEICTGPTFSEEELRRAGAFEAPAKFRAAGPLFGE